MVNSIFVQRLNKIYIYEFELDSNRPQFTSYILDTFTKEMCREVEEK